MAAPRSEGSFVDADAVADRISGYTLRGYLGDGRSGMVYRATKTACPPSTALRTEYAVKIFRDEDADVSFHKELHFLQRIHHPNVAELHAFQQNPAAIVMPFYGENPLHAQVRGSRGFSEDRAAHVMRDLLAASQFIHGLEIIHRDIKPENIALTQHGKAVLLDFDSAIYTHDVASQALRRGTPGYMAPEVILGRTYTTVADLFGLGCVLYFMFRRKSPFYSKVPRTILRKTSKCKYSFGVHFDGLSSACKALISSLLEYDPSARASVEQAFTHEWLAEYAEGLTTFEKDVSEPDRVAESSEHMLLASTAISDDQPAAMASKSSTSAPESPRQKAIESHPLKGSVEYATSPLTNQIAPVEAVAPSTMPAVQRPSGLVRRFKGMFAQGARGSTIE